jgi:hypothetical protein
MSTGKFNAQERQQWVGRGISDFGEQTKEAVVYNAWKAKQET